jgi:hypothetical protein
MVTYKSVLFVSGSLRFSLTSGRHHRLRILLFLVVSLLVAFWGQASTTYERRKAADFHSQSAHNPASVWERVSWPTGLQCDISDVDLDHSVSDAEVGEMLRRQRVCSICCAYTIFA